MKGLSSDLRISALQVAAAAKSFQEVVDFVIDLLFTYFSFLDTLRFSNLRIECSCGDDFQIFGIISIEF